MLISYVEEIIEDHHCEIWRNRLTTDRYSAFARYWRKKWEYNVTGRQLFIDFEEAYDSVRREVLYNILIEISSPLKIVRLIKLHLNETYRKSAEVEICVMYFLLRLI
jgi:hypothetical protein